PLTAAGNSTSEGLITRSTDGKFIVATGYATAPGTPAVAGTAAATVNRVIGRIAADATIDTSTTLTSFSGGNIRSAASTDGSSFWASGSNTGVVYQGLGGTGNGTTVSSNVTNLRALGIAGDQLYVTSASGSNRMLAVGTGLPTTTGAAATQLPGFPTGTPSTSPYGFFFADLDAGVAGVDTLYVADSSANAIQKYSLVAGSWTASGTATASGVTGLTGSVSGTTVTLYATAGSRLWSLSDSTGYNASVTSTVVQLATPSTNTAFRGIAFAPEGGVVVVVPTLATPSTSAVTTVTATLNGNVTDAGGAQVTARGFVYSITSQNANPQIGGSNVIQQAAGTGPGTFSANVASLVPGTQYTVKAYATNSAGTAYSSVITFTTNSATTAPVLAATPTSSAILDIQALLGGTVTSDGGAAVTERGIVISLTSANPTPTIGGAGVTTVLAALGTGTGTFTTLVEGLAASGVYSFRAYATNSVGTDYSDVATLNTAAAATGPVIGTPTKTNITSTTATLGGQVTADGGRPVTERGVVYSKTSVNADPLIDGTGVTKSVGTLGIGIGTFTVAVTGLEKLTDYTFKAYATNSAGTSYTTLDTFTTYDTPTTLAGGDVAFTGFDPAGADKLSFVLLTSVVAGTTLTLTDNSWTGTALSTNEGSSVITFTNAFSAGTLFDYDGSRTTNQKWQWGANAGSPSATGVSDVTSNFSFAAGGDNVFAYQGTAPTTGSASNWVAGFASLSYITSGTPSTGNTYLPTALTIGDTAFSLDYAVGAIPQSGELILLDPNPVTGTPLAIRTTVYTTSNWQADVTTFPLGTTFVVSAGSATIGTTGTFSALTTTYGTASTTTSITVSGSGLTGNVTATAPAGFQVSSDGTNFGSTATFVQSGGSASGTLSVRIPATTGAGLWSGSVSLASTGATGATAAIPSSTVNKKALVVTADDKTREWNQPNAFTATITGFVNGETATALSGSPSLTSTATQSSAPGTYSIVAALGTLASDNYSFPTFNNGTLTVTIATVTFNVPLGDSVTDTTVRTGYTRIVKQGAGTLTLNQATRSVSGTVVDAGTLIVANGDALGTGTTTVNATGTLQVGSGVTVKTQTVTIAGGTLAAAGATILVNATTGIGTLAIASGSVTGSPSLTVSGNGVVSLPTDRRQLMALTALSVDQAGGGRIDIGKGRIDIGIGGITETDLRADVIAGRNSGAFNGTTGIMTTGGKASPTSANPAVGYRVLGTGAAIVAWASYGDTNLDGQVNSIDVSIINTGARYNAGSPATWSQGDFNYSNTLNSLDVSLMNSAALYQKGSYLPVTPSAAAMTSSTPIATSSSTTSLSAWAAFAIDEQT
ncbi:MAG: beta strand repeat-containing protein, partial [Pirellulales bacterium]